MATDTRTQELARKLTQLAKRRRVSQNKLANAGGIKPTQWSGVLHGRQGVSLEKLLDAAASIGAVLDIVDASEANPAFLGEVHAGGHVALARAVTLPGLVRVQAGFGDFSEGDELLLVEGTFESGAWLLVQSPDGIVRFWRCGKRNQVDVLTNAAGEAMLFDPELHAVVGVAEELRRPLRA